ncbi:MAG: ATP cone domain-containing protein [Promethearchaeota archaeon]
MLVRKASGKMEEFQPNKIRRTLLRAGASKRLADEIVDSISKKMYDGITTDKIMDMACKLMAKRDHYSACRYGLKQAIMRLGPTGYPFETFIGELLKKYDYKIELRQNVRGLCVEHEIDVVAVKASEGEEIHSMIECKYRNTKGQHIELKEMLFTYARFLDLMEGWEKGKGRQLDNVWFVSNAKASQAVKKYAKCRGIKLICWNYPNNGSIRDIIERKNLYPVTVLRTIDKAVIRHLSDLGIMFLCDLLEQDTEELAQLTGLSNSKIEKIFHEAEKVLRKSPTH